MRFLGAGLLLLALVACPGSGPEFVCNPSTNAECLDGYTCDPTSKKCLRSCNADTDCLALQSCDTQAGVCRHSSANGDTDVGDTTPAGDPNLD
jgi:hypothetical protein